MAARLDIPLPLTCDFCGESLNLTWEQWLHQRRPPGYGVYHPDCLEQVWLLDRVEGPRAADPRQTVSPREVLS